MALETYNEDQIQILEGLEGIRKRPGMYVGGTGQKGLHHILWEIIDNSVDEHLAGYCNEINVELHEDGSASVSDNGRGIPTGIHKKTGVSTLQTVLTTLHSGGKFGGDDSSYKSSGGLHGVGASCTNALSNWLTAEVRRDKKKYSISFSRGDVTSPLSDSPDPSQIRTGTTISFYPDETIFDEGIDFNHNLIYKRLRESAFLNRGLEINFTDHRLKKEGEEYPESFTFFYERGIAQYVELINEKENTLHDDVVFFEGEEGDTKVEVAFQYTDSEKVNIYSFVNNITTTQGGKHESGFKKALLTTIKEYIKTHNLKKKDIPLPEGEDARQGLTAIISIRMVEPQFDAQTKAKLTSGYIQTIVDRISRDKIMAFLEENIQFSKTIIEKINRNTEVRLKVKKYKEQQTSMNKMQNHGFSKNPEKLAPCASNDKDKTEIYIVEGDSAGGSAKQGRDREFQAILPLRGKVINSEKHKLEKILQNNEIQSISMSLGTGIGENFDIDKLKYKKIVIMADADVDGAHILALLITFFYRYMRPLIEKGYVYLAKPPLYKLSQGKKVRYAYTDREKEAFLSTIPEGSKVATQRYKGLGEMNPIQLWETTMDPTTRTLIQLTMEDAEETEKAIQSLMGDEVEERRELLITHGHEANLDI